MRCRGFLIGLTAALMAVSTVMIGAGPAGAANSCDETMNPAAEGNASGLIVSCLLDSPGASLVIEDYADAVWHYGAARNVNVTVQRTANSTAGKTTIKSRPTNNTTVASCANSPAGQTGIPAGNLEISAADINHSVENAVSSATLTGVFINPGSFIKTVVATGTGCTKVITVTLSKATVAGGPLCPASPGPAAGNCTNSVGANVLVSNDTGRSVNDGATGANSNQVTSVSANFKPADVGMSLSGGNLPDGATIASVAGNVATLACTGCVGGFVGVSAATGLVITLTPSTPPTTSRFVTNGTPTGRTITTSTGNLFANSDIGLPIAFVPPIATLAGARVGTVAANGTSATLAGAGTATIPAGTKKFVVGLSTKTAPATGDSQGTLSIVLKTNPSVSPTSPPCSANKVSGFHIPLTWRNPQGTAAQPAVPVNTPSPGYNMFIGGNHFSGTTQPAVSIAQLDFRTASTSFAGYVQQTYTVAAGVQSASTYRVNYPFVPIGAGVCPGTGLAGTWSFFGLTNKIAANPSFTGGGGGGARGITDEPQGTTVVYSGSPRSATSGAYMTGGTVVPTNNNSCTITSPAVIQIGC
jgi:hypothetical protein